MPSFLEFNINAAPIYFLCDSSFKFPDTLSCCRVRLAWEVYTKPEYFPIPILLKNKNNKNNNKKLSITAWQGTSRYLPLSLQTRKDEIPS